MKVDDIKAKAEHYDIPGKAAKAEAGAKKAAKLAKDATVNASERAAEMTYQHRGQIDAQISKAQAALNRRTSGKYASGITKATGYVRAILDRFSALRPAAKAAKKAGKQVPPTTTD